MCYKDQSAGMSGIQRTNMGMIHSCFFVISMFFGIFLVCTSSILLCFRLNPLGLGFGIAGLTIGLLGFGFG